MITYQSVYEKMTQTAADIWLLRNDSLVMNEQREAEDLLRIHDALISVATDMFSRLRPVRDEQPEQDTFSEPTILSVVLEAFMSSGDWDVKTLSESSGVSKDTIQRILDGKTTNPHAKTIEKLESVLGVSFDG